VKPAALAALILLLLSPPLAAQEPPAAPAAPSVPVALVPTEGLAGQQVAVMPLTLLVAEPTLQSDSLYAPYRDRRTALLWADSLIGEAFSGRAPEVQWVLPPRLRKLARRSPGLVNDPDQMGQAALRAPKLREIHDPLRSSLRNLMAVVGGRVVMVPAALGFALLPDRRVHADLSLVAADTRSGKVLWRSQAGGYGATPDAALQAALASVLPIDPTGP
jgi:hypothetical protein